MVRAQALAAAALCGLLYGCPAVDDAAVASNNLTRAADNFELQRRVVLYNVWTGEYLLEIVGRCSVESKSGWQWAICEESPGVVKRHQMTKSANALLLVEQIEAEPVSYYHNRVIFKPQSLLPAFELRTKGRTGDK